MWGFKEWASLVIVVVLLPKLTITRDIKMVDGNKKLPDGSNRWTRGFIQDNSNKTFANPS